MTASCKKLEDAWVGGSVKPWLATKNGGNSLGVTMLACLMLNTLSFIGIAWKARLAAWRCLCVNGLIMAGKAA